MNNKGTFIAFEGIDGCGKTTQLALLAERVKETGRRCYTTAEPSEGPVGNMIRQILKGRIKADKKVIAALFAADRLDHLTNEVDGILKKLDDGITVLTDRYNFSSYAYQGVDAPLDWVIGLNKESRKLLKPTATIFIDVDPDVALERISRNRFHTELFEKKSMLIKVRELFMEAFELLKEEETVIIIDGNQSPEKIAEDIWEKVQEYFR